MTTGPQPAPILDDEFLLRRIPKHLGWYHPGQIPLVDEQAFRPTDQDTTGLSLEREQSAGHPEFKSIEEAAQGSNPNGYLVAVLSVRELRSHGVRIEPRIENTGPGHVEWGASGFLDSPVSYFARATCVSN
jgi:hypothetical protein